MESIGQKSFRLLKKIKDPKFEIDRLEFYSLSLFLGKRDFHILIRDAELNYCLLLEDYVFAPDIQEHQRKDLLRYIFDDHHLLLANFWKSIQFVIKNRDYTFIPAKLFEEENIAAYLKLNTAFDPQTDEAMLTYHKQLDMVNVFTVPKYIIEMIESIYPGNKPSYIHQSSTLINGLLSINQPEMRDVALYIDRFGLHIMVVYDKKLVFYNQYVIRKFSDYLKYIRLVANELDINLNSTVIQLYGFLGKNTPHFRELKKAIPYLTLGDRPKNFKFGYVFDEIADHQYFDVFSTDLMRF